MIPELLSFSGCCGQLPCQGGYSQILFSLTVGAVDGVPPGSHFHFGLNSVAGCAPNLPYGATPEATALVAYHAVLAGFGNTQVVLSGSTVTWAVTVQSIMDALGSSDYGAALAILTSYCGIGFTHCSDYAGEYEGADPITFSYECSCAESVASDAPDCCNDPCYQAWESFAAADGGYSLPFLAKNLLAHLADYAAINDAFPDPVPGFPTATFPDIMDYGQACYDFTVKKTLYEDEFGIIDRFSAMWTPRRGNPCLHAFAIEADKIQCLDSTIEVRAAVAAWYQVNGYAPAEIPVLTEWNGNCDVAFLATGFWRLLYQHGGFNDTLHVWPCDAATMGLPPKGASFCDPFQSWCLKAMPGDRVAFVLEDSVKDLLQGTYAVGLASGGTACDGPALLRIGSVYVVTDPKTGRKVGFLDADWPNVAPGCYKMVISSEGAEDFPAIEVGYGNNLLAFGTNGTFDALATWHNGITAHTGVSLTQFGETYRSPFFSLRVNNPTNYDRETWVSDAVTGLEAGQSYRLSCFVNARRWPTDLASYLEIGFVGMPGGNTVTLLSVLPTNADPLGEWIEIAYQIDAGPSPDGFRLAPYWQGPDFGSIDSYDVLFDDFTLRRLPYTIPATAPSAGVNLCSRCVTTLADACLTGEVRYVNDGNGLGYPYAIAPDGYTQQFRLGMQRKEFAFLSDRSQYTNSQGRTVVNHSRMRMDRDCEVFYKPEWVHEILALALEHDDFELRFDGQGAFEAYVNEKDYKVTALEVVPNPALRKATFTLRKKDYDKVNGFC